MRLSVRFFLTTTLALAALGFHHQASAIGTASKIAISPATTTLVAGQTQTFTVSATVDGTATDVTSQSTFSSDDPRGTFAGATYTPGKSGSWTLQAAYQNLTAQVTVTVTPGAVQELSINPNSEPETATIGKAITFSAVAYDAMSNVVENQSVTWSVVGDIGTVTNAGVFTATTLGTGKVQANVGSVTGQVTVVTQAAPVVNTNTTVTNTATAINKNTNTTNQNTNASLTNTASTTASTKEECTTLKPWAWTLMLIIFMLVVVVFYALIPVTKIWPVVVALVAAAALAYVQRTYGCGEQTWWAWVMTLGTIGISAIANTLRPKSTPTN